MKRGWRRGRSRASVTPGRTAKAALASCSMYSLSASCAARRLLQRDELPARVALERDEEEARVELAGRRVDAVAEVVAAAQDPQAVVLGRRREPDVRVLGDDAARRRRPSRRAPGASCSSTPPSGAPDALRCGRSSPPGRRATSGPSARAACGCGASPCTCRPSSTPARRRRPTHTCSRMSAASVGVEVVRAVLEALQVAGRRLRARSTRRGRIRAASSGSIAMSRPMRARLRNAWNATVASSAQHCSATSPLGAGRVEVLAAAERGDLDERRGEVGARGRAGRDPCASTKTLRPRPTVIVSFDGGSSCASPVSAGAATRLRGFDRADGLARGEQRRRGRPTLEQRLQTRRGRR